ncbi:alpha/beta hydrolase [Actinomadura flavalba]|uniref:alpha/beta hydrolase n=1 Tax=Actinomadura flavalba TaxID=1120938 RepID=UPI0003A961CC|nr:alpha/beta hydrolase [Actinomadura flavalba]
MRAFRKSPRRIPPLLLVAAVTAALLPTAAPAAAGPPPGAAPVAPPVWRACPDLGEPAPGLRCATLRVPLDHARPSGPTIDFAVSMLPATSRKLRRGVLVLEPGGTDRSELALPARLAAQGMPASVRERYDLIGFDPRGIGRSSPVTCDLRPGQDLSIPASQAASGPAAVARRAAELRVIARQCGASATGAQLPHQSTANVARDVDRLRVALGERKISYLGYSYGTYVGAVYATLFPHRTDRVVLDSVVGPGGMDHTWSRRLGRGVEDRFPDFARWAAARHAEYGLGRTPAQVRASFHRIAAKLERRPAGGYDGPGFRYLTFSSLFADAIFPDLARTWSELDRGTAAEPPPSTGVMDFSGLISLACNDGNWRRDVGYYQRAVALDRLRYPIFGASGANLWPCAFWPVQRAEPPVRIGQNGPSNVLLVSNLRDPGTPYVGATAMRRALGARARLVSVDQGGHLVYLYGVSACADAIVTRFLVTGERPRTDVRCA